MGKPVTLSNTFAAQAGPIPLVQLDQNFVALRDAINDPGTYQNYVLDTSVTPNAYAVAPNPAWTVYTAGMWLQFKASLANTGACTVNVSSLGNKSIVTNSGAALLNGQIPAGSIVSVQYDGTNFKLHDLGVPHSSGTYSISLTTGANDSGTFAHGLATDNIDFGVTAYGSDAAWGNAINISACLATTDGATSRCGPTFVSVALRPTTGLLGYNVFNLSGVTQTVTLRWWARQR